MCLYQILASTIQSNIIQNKKFKIPGPTWYNKFELSEGSYFVSDIQYYFELIIKKHWLHNPRIMIYLNKIENNIKFKIMTDYFLELLITFSNLETLKVRQLMLYLKNTEVVLFHCNIVNNDYQQDSVVICAK